MSESIGESLWFSQKKHSVNEAYWYLARTIITIALEKRDWQFFLRDDSIADTCCELAGLDLYLLREYAEKKRLLDSSKQKQQKKRAKKKIIKIIHQDGDVDIYDSLTSAISYSGISYPVLIRGIQSGEWITLRCHDGESVLIEALEA